MANKKYNDNLIKLVVEECKYTGTKKAVAKKYGIPLTTLSHWINNENAIKTDNNYSEEIKIQIAKEYLEGATITELCKKYSIVEGTINRWIKPIARKRGVTNKVGSENFFDEIDSERKAYYLGWLMADGNVSVYNGQYSLKIHIQLKDRELIDNFVKDIDCTNSILEKENLQKATGKYHKSCYISITSVHMVKALIELGVKPNKTMEEHIPALRKELIPHFIRGFFDGDGIASCTEHHATGFVSNHRMLEEIEQHIPLETKIIIHKKTPWLGTRQTGSRIKAKRLYDYIYKDATVYLQRKHDTLKAIIDGNTEVTCSNTSLQ